MNGTISWSGLIVKKMVKFGAVMRMFYTSVIGPLLGDKHFAEQVIVCAFPLVEVFQIIIGIVVYN